jgi:hypothetical protein
MGAKLARLLAVLVMAGCKPRAPVEYPTADFPLPTDTVLTPYVNLPVGTWLGGTSWGVVSSDAAEAVIVDFSSKSKRALGSKKAGGTEIRNPVSIFVSSDTIWVTDWALSRATQWTLAGAAAGTVPSPPELRGALPVMRDAAGQLYYEIRAPARRDGSGNRDSAAIVRQVPTAARFDTVGRLSPLDLAEVNDAAGRRFERRIFSGLDRWGVLRDGTLWIARVYQNFVAWSDPSGKMIKGPDLPDRVIEVTITDRDQFISQFPEELRSTAEGLPFAPLKPPFENALTAPDGEVWLEKSRPVVDSTRTYHLVDRQGGLRRVLVLPSRQGHVIAVGDTLALVAEQWREGVRLMQVRIPR